MTFFPVHAQRLSSCSPGLLAKGYGPSYINWQPGKLATDTPVGLSDEDISSVEVPRCDKLITRISHHVMSVTLITVSIREAVSVTAAVIGP